METVNEQLLSIKLAAAGEMGLVLAHTQMLNVQLCKSLLEEPGEGTVIGDEDRKLLETFIEMNEAAETACNAVAEAAAKAEAEVVALAQQAPVELPGHYL